MPTGGKSVAAYVRRDPAGHSLVARNDRAACQLNHTISGIALPKGFAIPYQHSSVLPIFRFETFHWQLLSEADAYGR
ncbi:hypothetical protein EDF58_108109 [Novosphingobium sp. PhB57]|nr:hypothetical protein EDF58_108109 [Novosphingobium sp. PhB57]